MKKSLRFISACMLLTCIISNTQAVPVIKDNSLMIKNLEVVNDPLRTVFDASNLNPDASTWTFGRLMENMSGPHNVSDFVLNWLSHWEVDQNINGFNSPARPNIRQMVTQPWLDASANNGAPPGTLDMSLAPFRLLAIVNRLDLRETPSLSPGDAGEGRFVFGVLDQSNFPMSFTVIFEYELPAATAADVRQWAEDWDALSQMSNTDPAFNQALQAITERFSGQNTMPSKPNGNAVNQVRTNEIALSFEWELREFTIDSISGQLKQGVVALTPDLSLDNSPILEDFLNQNAAAILKERHTVPLNMLGASAPVPFFPPWATNLFNVDDDVKQKFAVNTCNGCHLTEVPNTPFTHVSVRSANSVSQLSGFLDGGSIPDPRNPSITRNFNDLQRRLIDLNNLLHVKSDFNGSGRSDIIVRTLNSADLTILQMNGINHLPVIPAIPQTFADKIVGTGDIDGDKSSEGILYDTSSGLVQLLTLNNINILSTQSNTNAKVIGVDDLNGDGTDEIIWFDNTSGQVTAWQIINGGVNEQLIDIQTNPIEAVLVDDSNGDGQAEIIWKIDNTADITIWEINNFSKFAEHILPAPGTPWTLKASGDFDHDGKSDLVWLNKITSELLFWEMGDFKITTNHIMPVALDLNQTKLVTIGDHNGDASTDIIWQNTVTGDLTQWQIDNFAIINQGNLSLQLTPQDEVVAPLTIVPEVVAILDIDNDGVADSLDNCPSTPNPDQSDNGGLNSTIADGIGDACQCGDINGDGTITNTDSILIKRFILSLPSPFRADFCDINGDAQCTNTDAILIQRAILNLPPGIQQTCTAAGN